MRQLPRPVHRGGPLHLLDLLLGQHFGARGQHGAGLDLGVMLYAACTVKVMLYTAYTVKVTLYFADTRQLSVAHTARVMLYCTYSTAVIC